ncbi:MAG: hypothetical protein KDB62_09880 [Solirubrobacterales bacterium]|nr:hypothetical protein [Solirubrobacterales bacterium]
MAEPSGRPARRKSRPNRITEGYARSEARNQQVRDSLVPLEPGQRPTVVTVGASFATVVAAIFWVSSLIALFTSTEVNGTEPNAGQLIATALIMSLMAWGMWRARYWAVLGFQMLLVLLIIAAIAGLVVASSLVQAASTLVLTIGLGLLFFHMVKAMARIQMPERPSRD